MAKKLAIIGGGITGTSIARTMSRFDNLEIHLIEKNADLAWGATKANTGIIHPGHEDDPKKHPLRAKLCVKGNEKWKRWVEELDIPFERPGELMIAFKEDDLKILKKYKKLGRRNGVSDLRIIKREEILSLEPNISSKAIAALWGPTTGRIEPWEAVIALTENAVNNGLKTHFRTEVKDIKVKEDRIKGLATKKGFIGADIVVNAAGLYADKTSKMAGIEEFEINPRKGQYYLFDEDATPKVDKIVHPTPTPKTKGVYATKTVEGNLMLGPTSEDLPHDQKNDKSTNQEGLDHVWDRAKDLVKELPPKNKISKTFAGLRPEPPEGKYIIQAHGNPWGFVNVAGIRSPGLTAAPAIAEYVKKLISGKFDLELEEKENWKPERKGITKVSKLPPIEQDRLIKKNPKYGKIICMCKEISLAQIHEAIRRTKMIGIDKITLDSIKFRTLAMFGFCQGSFCRLKIAKTISEELNIPLWKVTSKGDGTEYGIGSVKVLRKNEEGD